MASSSVDKDQPYLSNTIGSNCRSNNKCSSTVTIPCYRQWIVKMWHFGVDTIEYTNKEFEVTFEEGISDLYSIYTKRLEKDGKTRVRTEHQEYPNQEYADAIVKKLFPGGHLIETQSQEMKQKIN